MRLETLFSELNGFVIFDLKKLTEFQNKYIVGNDILTPLIESNLGDVITSSGIAIPIIGVEPDDYGFFVNNNQNYINDVIIESKGWILESSGKLSICGVGYLKKFNLTELQEANKIITFDVPKKWLEIDIYTGINKNQIPVFEIVFNEVLEKPKFTADMSVNYAF